MEPTNARFRCGYVGIIGEPNVGKSTLMNGLLGQKISIVTKKPQTTRHKILGILSSPTYQVIFLDTPGIIRPRYALHEAMIRSAWSAVDDADLLLFMVDATRPGLEGDTAEEETLKRLSASTKPVYLVLNKVDLLEKSLLLPLIDRYAKRHAFKEIFPISALKLDGTRELEAAVVRELPEHPPLYPLDIVSEHQERFFVSEIIREKIFIKCQEEIPYSTTVDIVEFNEHAGAAGEEPSPPKNADKWFIRADIYVERDSQKGILIGKKASMLREIGSLARKDIERFLQHSVYLELHVKVREKWREDEQWLQRQGYKQ